MKAYPARIREWLKANPGAHTPQVILDAMGVPAGAKQRRAYYSAMKDNADAGYLDRTGTGRRTAYSFVADPNPRIAPTDKAVIAARAKQRRDYMNARHWAQGGRTQEQRRIDEALRKSARLERLEAEKQERALAREQRKAVNGRRRLAAAARVVRKAKATARAVIAVRSAPAVTSQPTPARAPAQSVEEFIRAGGQVIRLPGVEQHIRDRSNA
ncbi:hypothetical protein MUG10_01050 [Xanthomonas prunicola]|uniref:hypothetical protein n=1 Tax=Xanthomonas prunicola TaxID=2053930 RepID=UPI002078BADF|nr:hypothetical protein [Xanthomonas prunicola]USJ00884.1 hypothetical protein MUG10_01050 [Xanthomonas prunicola]